MSDDCVRASGWRPFSLFAYHLIVPQDQELEFLASADNPAASIRRGDVVRGLSSSMPLDLFSHWRPIAEGGTP